MPYVKAAQYSQLMNDARKGLSSGRNGVPVSLSSSVMDVATSVTNALLGPAYRHVQYQANSLRPNLIPDVSDLITLWNTGRISDNDFRRLCSELGIDINDPKWSGIIELSQQWPDLGMTICARKLGRISNEQWRKTISAYGIRNLDTLGLLLKPPFLFSPDQYRILRELGHTFPKGMNDMDGYEAALWANGIVETSDWNAFHDLYQPPDTEDVIDLLNRGRIDARQADRWLMLNGYTEESVRRDLLSLRYSIPSESRLIEYAIKEVWNKDVVEHFGYDDEFDQIPEFRYWMDKIGFGGSPNVPEADIRKMLQDAGRTPQQIQEAVDASTNQPKNWAQAEWREHWSTISPTQAYTMLHRLRPAGGKHGPRVLTAEWQKHIDDGYVMTESNLAQARKDCSFTIEDVARVLKVNDYPPFFREKLAAISFNTLRLVDIRRIVFLSREDAEFKQSAIGEVAPLDWAREQYLDRGQTPQDAQYLARMTVHEADRKLTVNHRKRTAQIRARERKNLELSYKVGTISRDAFISIVSPFPGAGRTESIRVADQIDKEVALTITRKHIASIEKLVLKGDCTIEEATKFLAKIGITERRIKQYSDGWKVMLDEDAIINATRSIIELYRSGLLPLITATNRLNNLGWTNANEILEAESAERMLLMS